jgi:hypothetical protein
MNQDETRNSQGVDVETDLDRRSLLFGGASLVTLSGLAAQTIGAKAASPQPAQAGNKPTLVIFGDDIETRPPLPAPAQSSSILDVKDFGAKGDGTTDDTAALQRAIEAAFVVCATHDQNLSLKNKQLFVSRGRYRITSPLRINGAFGIKMCGAGRMASQIWNTAGGTVLACNGLSYSHISDLNLAGQKGDGGACIDADWKGSTYAGTQQNTFQNLFFSGSDYGLRFGNSGWQADTTLVLNCSFNWHDKAGLITKNFNAVADNVVGGNFQNCRKGIVVRPGSVNVVSGVSFQNSSEWDIYIEGSANNTMTVTGCSTESNNFLYAIYQAVHVSGCEQRSVAKGTFVRTYPGNNWACISACTSYYGQLVLPNGGKVSCFDCGRDDWFSADSFFLYDNVVSGKTLVQVGSGTQKHWISGTIGTPPANWN